MQYIIFKSKDLYFSSAKYSIWVPLNWTSKQAKGKLILLDTSIVFRYPIKRIVRVLCECIKVLYNIYIFILYLYAYIDMQVDEEEEEADSSLLWRKKLNSAAFCAASKAKRQMKRAKGRTKTKTKIKGDREGEKETKSKENNKYISKKKNQKVWKHFMPQANMWF